MLHSESSVPLFQHLELMLLQHVPDRVLDSRAFVTASMADAVNIF